MINYLLPPDNGLTPHTLFRALSSVRTIWTDRRVGLLRLFDIPYSVQNKIRSCSLYSSEVEKITAALQYALNTLPGMSWRRIAGVLWFMEEHTALEKVRQYLPHKPGDFITCMVTFLVHVYEYKCGANSYSLIPNQGNYKIRGPHYSYN